MKIAIAVLAGLGRMRRIMLAKVLSAAVNGIEAFPVEVEVNAGWGDTNIVIVVNKTPKRTKALILLGF